MTLDLKGYIRTVPDFPQKGVLFRDISPLLADPNAWHTAIDRLAERVRTYQPNILMGLDARGFLVAAPLAYKLGIGFCMARKPGKLPWETVQQTYTLEYGKNALEISKDTLQKGQNVLICDDLLATGGTANAAKQLIEKCGAKPIALACLIELEELSGRKVLGDLAVEALMAY